MRDYVLPAPWLPSWSETLVSFYSHEIWSELSVIVQETVNNALREFLHITNCRAECSRKLCDYRVITAGVEFALLRWGRVVTWKVVCDTELALWLDNLRSAISFSLTSNIPNFVSYIILIRHIDIYIYGIAFVTVETLRWFCVCLVAQLHALSAQENKIL